MVENEIPSIASLRHQRTSQIDDAFVGTINQVGGILPDETKLRGLLVERKNPKGSISDAPQEWRSLTDNLSVLQRGALMRVIIGASRHGYETVGDLRQASFQELIDKPNTGPIYASMLINCFKRSIP